MVRRPDGGPPIFKPAYIDLLVVWTLCSLPQACRATGAQAHCQPPRPLMTG
jgi:hypothetical protein